MIPRTEPCVVRKSPSGNLRKEYPFSAEAASGTIIVRIAKIESVITASLSERLAWRLRCSSSIIGVLIMGNGYFGHKQEHDEQPKARRAAYKPVMSEQAGLDNCRN
jgi:hypothetical protein